MGSIETGRRARRIPTLALAALAVASLAGCSVMGNRESPINKVTAGSPTVVEIYRGQADIDYGGLREATPQERLHRDSRARPIVAGDGATNRYWSALEPLQQRFARVPNPDLVMVVYPHLAQGKHPVPAYVTAFPMYEQTFYAQPGEVSEDLIAAHARRAAPEAARAARPEPQKAASTPWAAAGGN